MLKLLARLYRGIQRISWFALLLVALVSFTVSWAMMAYFESGKPIAEIANFWWFFFVTSFTVGYGDLFPATQGGRFAAILIMIVDIGLLAVFAAKIADTTLQIFQRRRKGMLQVHDTNHLVILGYRPGDTEDLIRELRNGTSRTTQTIVLVAKLSETPLEKEVEFVAGDPTDRAVLGRANLAKAARVIVWGETDAETLAVAQFAEKIIHPDAHVVAYFVNQRFAEMLREIAPGIECVYSIAVAMLAQCVEEPGAMTVITDLVTNGGANQYRTDLPATFGPTTFVELMNRLKRSANLTLIGVATSPDPSAPLSLNPSPEFLVRGGMSILYIADERLDPRRIVPFAR